MIKRVLSLSLFIIALSIQPSVASAELKIGFFNFGKIIQNVPQTKHAEKKLEAEFEPKKKKIAELQKSLKAKTVKYEKDAPLMTEENLVKMQRAIRTQEREYQLLVQDYKDDFSIRRNQEMSGIQKIVYKEALNVAKEDGLDLLLQNGVLYASPKVDITDKILKRLSGK